MRLAFVAEALLDAAMLTVAQKPLFHVVLNDGDQWSVEAEWPDGTIEQINTFKHHYEAVDWLNAQSERRSPE